MTPGHFLYKVQGDFMKNYYTIDISSTTAKELLKFFADHMGDNAPIGVWGFYGMLLNEVRNNENIRSDK